MVAEKSVAKESENTDKVRCFMVAPGVCTGDVGRKRFTSVGTGSSLSSVELFDPSRFLLYTHCFLRWSKPLDGFTLDESEENVGDEIERTVRWQNGSDVSRLAGNPVRLRFRMKDADLYSIRFR